MDGWMDGWMDGGVGWMGREVGGWVDREVGGLVGVWPGR